MARAGCLLLQTATGWQIAAAGSGSCAWLAVDGGPDVTPGVLAAAVEQYVVEHRLSRRRVAIGLASQHALASGFTLANPADARNRRLMSYQLEDGLPLSAEEFVADFVIEGPQVLGVAVPTGVLAPIVAALEARGLRLQSIAPAALMAMQSLTDESRAADHDLVAWHHESRVELFGIGRRVSQWRHLSDDPRAVSRELAAIALGAERTLRVLLVNVSENIQAELSALGDVECQRRDVGSFGDQARRFAGLVLSGSATPWVELRRDGLSAGDPHRAVRGAWGLWCVSAAVLVLALNVLLWARTVQYDRAVDQAFQRRAALYRRAFPNAAVPPAVVARLQSERTRLEGERSADARLLLPPSALDVLHALLRGLPATAGLRVEQIRIEGGQFDVDAEVPSVGEAGRLADAWQKQGFAVEPPSTEQRSDGHVTVRIHGQLQAVKRASSAAITSAEAIR